MNTHALNNVLITRPLTKALALSRLLEKTNINGIVFPTIEIKAYFKQENANEVLKEQSKISHVIFVSQHAVEHSKKWLIENNFLRSNIHYFAVGEATKDVAQKAGFEKVIYPDSFNSEAILELDEFKNISDSHVLIVKGVGGREHLAKSLEERGARVCSFMSYERRCPNVDITPVIDIGRQNLIQFVIFTSYDAMCHLLTLSGDARSVILTIPPIVVSQRLARLTKEIGFRTPALISESVSNESLEKCIKNGFDKRLSA